MKGNNRKRRIFIVCTMVVLIIGVFFLTWKNAPVNKVLKAIGDKNFTYAIEIYEKNIRNDSEQTALIEDELGKLLEEKKKEFFDEKITYEEIKEILKVTEEFEIANINRICTDIDVYIEKINSSRNSYKAAEASFLEEDYASAIKKYELVVSEDSYYEKAREKRQEAENAYKKEILSDVEEKIQVQNYENALVIIEQALQLLGGDNDLMERKELYESQYREKIIQETLSIAETAYQEKDYMTALEILKECMQKYEAEEVGQKFDKYYKEYLEKVLYEIENTFEESGHQGAIDKLNEYYSMFCNDAQYLSVMEYYKSLVPDKLSSLNIFGSNDNVKYDGYVKDRLGNEFMDAFRVISQRMGTDGWFEYYINGKYTRMKGRLAHYYYTGDYVSNGEICLNVYADDILVYTSEWITTKTEPIEFSVDLTGVSYIKFICVEKETIINVKGPALILDSVELEKY